MLRFESNKQLVEFVTKVFGVTGQIGIRARCPKLKTKEGCLIGENSGINVVQGCEEADQPMQMRTQKDGVDLLFAKDGYMKISVRFRLYLLSYDATGYPMNCSCPDLLDLLLHYPKEDPILEAGLENLDSNMDDDQMDLEDAEVGDVTAIEEADQNTASTASSKSDLSSDVVPCRVMKKHRTQTDVSDNVLLNVGTCFRTAKHNSVWKIIAIESTHVIAKVINPG